MKLLASLSHRSFAWLWFGQTISRLGDSIYRIALAWWVLERTGSAAAMGTVLIFTSVPMIVFLLFGGVVVDRFSRTRVMLVSDLGRGLVVALIVALSYAGRLEIWHIYLASIVFGFIDAFFQPAFTALVPEVTPAAALPSANSLTSLSERLTGVLGPALGALFVSAGGISTAFLLDGVTFFVSAACLVPLLALSVTDVEHKGGVLSDLREGLATVRRLPWLWITILTASLANITTGSVVSVAMPFLVDEHLHADVGVLGWIYSTISAGSVVAAFWFGQQGQLRRRGWTIYLALIATGAAITAFGLSFGVAGALVAGFIQGLSVAIIYLTWLNTMQEQVPREQLGRVASLDMLGSFVLLPIGFGIVGWMTDLMGPASIFISGGLITILLALLALLHPGVRSLD